MRSLDEASTMPTEQQQSGKGCHEVGCSMCQRRTKVMVLCGCVHEGLFFLREQSSAIQHDRFQCFRSRQCFIIVAGAMSDVEPFQLASEAPDCSVGVT